MAMLQFKVWESGRVDLAEVKRYLVDSMRHALWDINMEYCLLTAPIMPSMSTPQHPTPASEPTTPKKGKCGSSVEAEVFVPGAVDLLMTLFTPSSLCVFLFLPSEV